MSKRDHELYSAQHAGRLEIREYLEAAYKATPEQVQEALSAKVWDDKISSSRTMGSMAYYVGDQIAAANDWQENPDFKPDDYEEEDEEENYE